MKHLDLFSGIGGFALAAEMVWDNVEHTFCDNEPFAQAILRKHWPAAAIYGDIRTLTANAESERIGRKRHIKKKAGYGGKNVERDNCERAAKNIYLLTGGFPCQPFSQAGRRRGTQDDRYLWPEMLRVIREFKPQWVVGENVGGLVTWDDGVVLEQIHADLESEDYEVQAFVIPAIAVNAPHRRDRVWIVAHRVGDAQRGTHRRAGRLGERGRKKQDEREGNEIRGDLANSDTQRRNAPDTAPTRLQQRGKIRGATSSRSSRGRGFTDNNSWEQNWIEVATRLCRVDDGIPRRLDRNPRLKALGNAIVPQVAAEIFKAIKEIDVA